MAAGYTCRMLLRSIAPTLGGLLLGLGLLVAHGPAPAKSHVPGPSAKASPVALKSQARTSKAASKTKAKDLLPRKGKKPRAAALAAGAGLAAGSALAAQSLAQRPEALAWGQALAQDQGLPPEWVKAQLVQAKVLPSVRKLVLPPASPAAKNWAAYRERFIEPRRIEAGLAFWQRHEAALARAQAEFGVPAEFIVSIIGVETFYGRHMGNFRILDALATLAFDFPTEHPRAAERQAFFRQELAQFLLLTQRSGADPLQVRGSYAGAMGLPQFMPSSWAKMAIDFDGDGRIDLFGSPEDAIGSVAHYFQVHQWKTGLPTHYPVQMQTRDDDMQTLLLPDILPTFTPKRLHELGARLDERALAHTGPLALIELRNGDQPPSFVAGTENFYAITRYNWSSYYAMAVIELAQALAQKMPKRP